MFDVYSIDRQHGAQLKVAHYHYVGFVETTNIELAPNNVRKNTHVIWARPADKLEKLDRLSAILKTTGAPRLAPTVEWAQADIGEYIDEQNNSVYFRQNEIIIGFRQRSATDVASVALKFGLAIKWFDRIGNFALFKLRLGTVGNLIKELQSAPEVQFAHPNVLDGAADFELSDLESDGVELPTTVLWNHDVLRRNSGWSSQDGSGVLICVIDTAIYLDHPGFSGQLIDPSRSFHFGDLPPVQNAHGTSVASIAVDKTLTRYGHSVGLSPAAKLLPVSIDTSSMSSYAGRARAVNFVAKIAADKIFPLANGTPIPVPRLVVNCSWKVEGTQDLTAVRQAFESLTNAGGVCVCSAGNSSNDAVHYPSDYKGCISVAGVTRDLTKSKNSSFGKSVRFAMPGGDGTPFDDADVLAAQASGQFDYVSGTSFAAPHASAMLASHWSRNPQLSSTELLQLVASKHTQSIDSKNPTLVGKLGAGLICFS